MSKNEMRIASIFLMAVPEFPSRKVFDALWHSNCAVNSTKYPEVNNRIPVSRPFKQFSKKFFFNVTVICYIAVPSYGLIDLIRNINTPQPESDALNLNQMDQVK